MVTATRRLSTRFHCRCGTSPLRFRCIRCIGNGAALHYGDALSAAFEGARPNELVALPLSGLLPVTALINGRIVQNEAVVLHPTHGHQVAPESVWPARRRIGRYLMRRKKNWAKLYGKSYKMPPDEGGSNGVGRGRPPRTAGSPGRMRGHSDQAERSYSRHAGRSNSLGLGAPAIMAEM